MRSMVVPEDESNDDDSEIPIHWPLVPETEALGIRLIRDSDGEDGVATPHPHLDMRK
jgi:hypothetical protein